MSKPAAEAAPTAPAPAEPAQPTPLVVEAHHAGGLNRSAARAAWPAVIAEVRKLKPGRAQLFTSADVDVDPDGETVVVEFPSDQSFSVQLAEEPEAREQLQRALASVLGYAPPVRYQLGKGPASPAMRRSVSAADADPPAAPGSQDPLAAPSADAPSDPDPPGDARDADPAATTDHADVALPDATSGSAAGDYDPGDGLTEPAIVHQSGTSQPSGYAPAEVETDDIKRLLTEHLGAQIVAEHAAPAEPPAEGEGDLAVGDTLDSAGAASYADAGLFENDVREGE